MTHARRIFELFISTRKDIPRDKTTHVVCLLFALAVTILPFFLRRAPGPGDEIQFAGRALPGRCASKAFFSAPCPGCGMTHAFMHAAQARPRESVRWNRVGILLYAYFVYQIFFRSLMLARPKLIESKFWINFQHYAALGMIALLFVNWAAGLWFGGNGS